LSKFSLTAAVFYVDYLQNPSNCF